MRKIQNNYIKICKKFDAMSEQNATETLVDVIHTPESQVTSELE